MLTCCISIVPLCPPTKHWVQEATSALTSWTVTRTAEATMRNKGQGQNQQRPNDDKDHDNGDKGNDDNSGEEDNKDVSTRRFRVAQLATRVRVVCRNLLAPRHQIKRELLASSFRLQGLLQPCSSTPLHNDQVYLRNQQVYQPGTQND